MTPSTICKNYLNELELIEKEIDLFNDKAFAPGMELNDVLHDLQNLEFTTRTVEERSKKEAKLLARKEELLELFHELTKEEPALDMPSLPLVTSLAKGKKLDNDGLCKMLKQTTNKTWTWSLMFDPKTTHKNFVYGITFKHKGFGISCFIGSSKNQETAKKADEQLRNLNWFEVITDIEERDEYNCHATCLRVPKEFRKAILAGLAKQCEPQKPKEKELA